ncbi:hypothetical protein WJX79_004155 [Trebouxia sp. C0005]
MNTFSNELAAGSSLPLAPRSCRCTTAVFLSLSVPRRTAHYCTVPAYTVWTVSHTSSRQQKAFALCAAPTDVVLPSVLDTSELEAQQEWLAGEIELWLNDEWTKLDVHRALGEATAQAYGKTRLQGSDEIGEVLLGISSELLTFDFKETFVNAFDVANKAAELLMKGMGREVCCG